ncbi:MAG TPA: hypothetical protein VFK13_00890 [Gemmatimonadaceae bacterium]|nr:hypothetical protein [Gemmatimonadaceae bacterium]
MPNHRLLTLAVMTLALAACNPFKHAPASVVSRDTNLNTRWHASLVSPATLAGAVQMNGSAEMQPSTGSEGTALSLSLANATPGGVHPWQVHRGQCGADEGVFGSADAYAPIKIGDDGRGEATATIPVMTPTTGSYFVLVGASAANAQRIVACGNLAPPTL